MTDETPPIPPFLKMLIEALEQGGLPAIVIRGSGEVVTGMEIVAGGSEFHQELSQEQIDEDHEAIEALQQSVLRTGETDITKLSDADKLRQLAFRLLLYGHEQGICIHRDHNPVAWMLLPIADRLELLDAGIAES